MADDPTDDEHWVRAMGLFLTIEDGARHGRALVVPEMFAPGTTRIRAGVLATMVDVVGGTPPEGIFIPTVDLRLQLWDAPPSDGVVHLVCHPLRRGHTLFVADVPLYADAATEPFGLGAVTFMTRVLDAETRLQREHQPRLAGTFDQILGARRLPDGTTELERHPVVSNDHTVTVQGGAQAMLAEVGLDHARGVAGLAPLDVDDLEIRYLDRLDEGPLVAHSHWHDAAGGAVVAQVDLTTAEDRLVSSVALRGLPRADPSA